MSCNNEAIRRAASHGWQGLPCARSTSWKRNRGTTAAHTGAEPSTGARRGWACSRRTAGPWCSRRGTPSPTGSSFRTGRHSRYRTRPAAGTPWNETDGFRNCTCILLSDDEVIWINKVFRFFVSTHNSKKRWLVSNQIIQQNSVANLRTSQNIHRLTGWAYARNQDALSTPAPPHTTIEQSRSTLTLL